MEYSTVNIQTLVKRLTSRLDLHRIFLVAYPYLEEERQHLLLIVNPVKGLSPKTMAPLVSLCLSDYEEFSFDLVLTGEWQNQLRQGSLYYTYASLPHHELYASTKKGNPLFSHRTVTGLLELAMLNYEKCRKSSDEFHVGAVNFVAKGDYGQATFMLHQFLELRVKGFRAAAGINSGKSHNIEHLLKSLRGVAPQLQTIFPYVGASFDLCRLLDQRYTKAKKHEPVAITQGEFEIVLAKCEHAAAEMDQMVTMMVDRITVYRAQLPKEAETQFLHTAAPTTQVVCEDFAGFPWPVSYKQDANTLLDTLRKQHNPEQIILLNYHVGGFSGISPFRQPLAAEQQGAKVELYLIVLMKNKGPFHFRCMRVGMASAMVVYMSVKDVEKKLASGNRFACTWWKKGTVLRWKSTFNPTFHMAAIDWKALHRDVKTRWQHTKASMVNLNEVIQRMPALTLDTGSLLLRSLLEMGITSYLRCAVGYIPDRINLAELIDWSGMIGRKVMDFTYPANQKEEACLYFILNPESVWQQDVAMSLSTATQALYRDKANELIAFFDGLCTEVLTGLQRKMEHAETTELLGTR